MSNQVATIEDITQENASLVYVAGGLKPFFEKVMAEVSTEVPDLKTAKGRERIASLAAKVSKSKVAVEKPGREYLKRLKEMPKVVEAELREFVTSMDLLRDEVRKPLTDWEASEQARKDKLQRGIDWFNLRANENADLDLTELKGSIAEVERITVGEKWEEFEAEAHRAKAAAIESLTAQLEKREKYEAEQAELSRLRAEAEERAQKDREEQITRDAAAKATAEAEAKASAEREAAAQKVKDEQAASERRELELKLQAEKAERETLEANKRAEQAERDSKANAEAAAEAERQKLANEQAERDRQTSIREADVAHKTSVLKLAKESLMNTGISEAQAIDVVNAIRKGRIPNVTLSF